MYSTAEISRLCRDAGVPVDDVSVVTESDWDPVYLLHTDDGRKYAKVAPAEHEDHTREAIASGVNFGMPDCRVLGTDPTLVVMAPAPGRPLSIVLPVLLAPGLWWWASANLTDGIKRVGEYLGRLHDVTRTGTEPIRIGPWQDSHGYQSLEAAAPLLDEAILAEARPTLRSLGDVETTTALVNGDPTPHNIYYRRGQVSIIDFTFRETIALRDCVVCDCGLELMCARLPYARSGQYRRLRDAFWQGYSHTADVNVDSSTVRGLKLRYYCHMLGKYRSRGAEGLTGRLTRVTDVRVLKREIRRLSLETNLVE